MSSDVQKYLPWRLFWASWLGGLALLIGLMVTGDRLRTPEAPNGILDHQSAATSERVDAIYTSWVDAGVASFATSSMVADLLFIAVYSFGGVLGARLLIRRAPRGFLRYLAMATVGLYVVFFLTDAIETVSQLVQHLSGRGSDSLAHTAATMQPIKIMAFLLASLGTICSLLLHRFMPAQGTD